MESYFTQTFTPHLWHQDASVTRSQLVFTSNPILQWMHHPHRWLLWFERRQRKHANLGVSWDALSCWGQQVGFLPPRDDAFYNEKVKEIIMEINSWTAMACELYQAELWISRAVLQCRTETGKPYLSSLLEVYWTVFIQPYVVLLSVSANVRIWLHVSDHFCFSVTWCIQMAH